MEFAGVGSVMDAVGWLPQFNETFFGKDVGFYALICMAASMLYDLTEAVLRPDIWPSPCVDDDAELPFNGLDPK